MTGQLVGWSVGWLFGWLVSWLVGWLVGWYKFISLSLLSILCFQVHWSGTSTLCHLSSLQRASSPNLTRSGRTCVGI